MKIIPIKKTGDFLFWFQLVCGLISGSTQAIKMLGSTQGLTFSFFLTQICFMSINLWLSHGALMSPNADKKMKSQSMIIYSMWTFFAFLHAGLVFWMMPVLWKNFDTMTSIIILVGTLIILVRMKIKHIPSVDPYIKMNFAILFKSIPQIILAITIFIYGGSGISVFWLLFGHIIIISRIFHLWLSTHEGNNRNTKASFVSEIWNEITWIIATLVWLTV